MIRAITASFVAVLACNLCHAGDQPKDKFAELEGTWSIVKMEMIGKSLLEKNKPKLKILIKDGKLIADAKEVPSDAKEALKDWLLSEILDPSKKPRTVTIRTGKTSEGKLTFIGIYEVDGDVLRVCGQVVQTATEKNLEATRPKQFDSNKGLLLVFKREKDKR
jgi:uncharacterized protein (TIGR03067 family)